MAMQDYLLINKILDREKVSLSKIIMKHFEHATSVQKHGIPYGVLIKKILEYCECYAEGPDTLVLGKPLNSRYLSQEFFKFEEGNKAWIKVPRPIAQVLEESSDVLLLEGPAQTS